MKLLIILFQFIPAVLISLAAAVLATIQIARCEYGYASLLAILTAIATVMASGIFKEVKA